jgi:hypothetical protein
MLNDAMNNLQIDLFKGPEGFINFALSAEFDKSTPSSILYAFCRNGANGHNGHNGHDDHED